MANLDFAKLSEARAKKFGGLTVKTPVPILQPKPKKIDWLYPRAPKKAKEEGFDFAKRSEERAKKFARSI